MDNNAPNHLPQRAAGGSFWTGSTSAPASSSPQDERPQPAQATMTKVLAKPIQQQDNTSEENNSGEDDALTRTLSQVKRRKRTSLACGGPAPAVHEESTRSQSQAPGPAVSTRTETGSISGTREAAPGKSDAQPPPLPPTGNFSSSVSPAMLQAYVFALAAQQKELQTSAWSALPPSFLHGGVQQQPRGGQVPPAHVFPRAPEGAWEARRQAPGVLAGSGRVMNSYWREGVNPHSH